VCSGFWCEILKERDHLEDISADGSIMSKMNLSRVGGRDVHWTDVAQGMDVVNTIRTGPVPQTCGKHLA
jgi:hypothetical protein